MTKISDCFQVIDLTQIVPVQLELQQTQLVSGLVQKGILFALPSQSLAHMRASASQELSQRLPSAQSKDVLQAGRLVKTRMKVPLTGDGFFLLQSDMLASTAEAPALRWVLVTLFS